MLAEDLPLWILSEGQSRGAPAAFPGSAVRRAAAAAVWPALQTPLGGVARPAASLHTPSLTRPCFRETALVVNEGKAV